MQRVKKTFFITAMMLSANSFAMGSSKPSSSSSSVTPWPKFSCQKKVASQIVVGANQTFDGKGCEYKWTGKYANKCDAPEEYSESVPKMFKLMKGATLKNVGVRCSPDGIEMGDHTRLENVWIHVEEDGVNISGSDDVRLKKVRFYQFSDKALQINPGTGAVTCDGCEFYDGNSAIKYDGNSRLIVSNSKFVNVKTGVRATKSPGRAYVSNTKFQNMTCAMKEEGGGRVQEDGGNSFSGVKTKLCK